MGLIHMMRWVLVTFALGSAYAIYQLERDLMRGVVRYDDQGFPIETHLLQRDVYLLAGVITLCLVGLYYLQGWARKVRST